MHVCNVMRCEYRMECNERQGKARQGSALQCNVYIYIWLYYIYICACVDFVHIWLDSLGWELPAPHKINEIASEVWAFTPRASGVISPSKVTTPFTRRKTKKFSRIFQDTFFRVQSPSFFGDNDGPNQLPPPNIRLQCLNFPCLGWAGAEMGLSWGTSPTLQIN
jgi:hypothetical protein